MTARRIAGEVIGAVELLAYVIVAAIAALWRKSDTSYCAQLAIIAAIAGLIGVGFALAF